MNDNNRTELCRVAYRVALLRLGFVPPGPVDGEGFVDAKVSLALMDPAEARKAKRRWRKAWRASLRTDLRYFEVMPKRRQKHAVYGGRWSHNKYVRHDDVIDEGLMLIRDCGVGDRPGWKARCARRRKVAQSDQVHDAIVAVMKEFGLMEDWKRGG